MRRCEAMTDGRMDGWMDGWMREGVNGPFLHGFHAGISFLCIAYTASRIASWHFDESSELGRERERGGESVNTCGSEGVPAPYSTARGVLQAQGGRA
jgi:hypothetical protein